MAIDPDPYRTLGLARDATREQIRVAYRRLAKIHHPDAAGPAALPRFLAIQAAYEQLIHGTGPGGRGGRSAAARRSWEADPERADATRRAYGGRARTSRPSRARPTGGAGTTGGASAGSNGTTGTTGSTGQARSTGGSAGTTSGSSGTAGGKPGATTGSGGTASGSTGRRRSKATLGSTSYDDAEGTPFEPDWAGASWYGTTSGTYWTLNPKEYADPRKHGPEYQERAKRAARAWSARNGEAEPGVEGGPGDEAPPIAEAQAEATDPEADGPDAPDAGPPPDAAPSASRGTPWWAASAGPQAAASESAARRPQGGGRRWWSDDRRSERRATPGEARPIDREPPPPPPDLGRAAADIARAMTDEHFGGLRGRVARAVIGWLPIAFAIGWAFGEITGCGRFAASCDGTADPFVLLLQGAVLALLVLVPALATLATVAAMALLGAALVGTFILSATGTAGDADARRQALGAVLLVAWLAGFGIAIVRRVRDLSRHGRPVS